MARSRRTKDLYSSIPNLAGRDQWRVTTVAQRAYSSAQVSVVWRCFVVDARITRSLNGLER